MSRRPYDAAAVVDATARAAGRRARAGPGVRSSPALAAVCPRHTPLLACVHGAPFSRYNSSLQPAAAPPAALPRLGPTPVLLWASAGRGAARRGAEQGVRRGAVANSTSAVCWPERIGLLFFVQNMNVSTCSNLLALATHQAAPTEWGALQCLLESPLILFPLLYDAAFTTIWSYPPADGQTWYARVAVPSCWPSRRMLGKQGTLSIYIYICIYAYIYMLCGSCRDGGSMLIPTMRIVSP